MQYATTDFYDLVDKILTEDLELVVSIAVIIVALVLVWLLLRGPRLWYWKVNQKSGTLKKIDSRLKHVENYLNDKTATNLIMQEKIDQVFTGKSLEPEEADTKAFGNATANQAVDGKRDAKSVSDTTELKTKSDEDKAVLESKKLAEDKIETYVGKSGRIYREDELEALIKD